MEIDRELEKLDSGSGEFGLVDGANGLFAEEHLASSTTIKHVEQNCGLNMEENSDNLNLPGVDIIDDHNHVDLVTPQVDGAVRAKNLEPQNGMEFGSKEAAYSLYREYAKSTGFGITIKASRRSKRSGKFIDVKIACSRFGIKRESGLEAKLKPCLKTDCKASLHIKRTQDEKWVVYNFVKEHNHDMCPEDFYHSLLGGNKKSGLIARQKKGLQLVLDEEDVQLMLEHLMHMQGENPNFFYAIDLDNEKHLKSVFWVDAKGRHDYSNFGDVVFFDTYYIQNNFRIPFVPIVGVNHHFQFILLGSALIGEKTSSAYVWLLQTWLKAMGGQCPKVVITDPDKVWKEPITEVLCHVRHCFCLWHVLSEIPENWTSENQQQNFLEKFNKCIYRSWTAQKFEKRWQKILEMFDLNANEWFQSVYKDRYKWVPYYLGDTFLAGFSTNKRSDCLVSLFDSNIHKETTFKEFLDSYKAFCFERREVETKADFETQQKHGTLESLSAFEKQMSAIYTPALFKKFQAEALGAAACHLHRESDDGETVNLWVNDVEVHEDFIVAWNENKMSLSCQCRSFECNGFLCRHALLVLQTFGISNVPSCYILKRWTKDAKTRKSVGETSKGHQYRFQRFNDLCKQAVRLAQEASVSQETYNIVQQALEEALKHCVGVNNSANSALETTSYPVHDFLNIVEENHDNNLARASIKRKSYKKRKVLLEMEAADTGQENGWRQESNSRVHPTGHCFLPQQDAHEMDFDSRPPLLDGYYGAQQSMPRVGQLGLRISSIHDCLDMHDRFQEMIKAVGSFSPTSSKHIQEKQYT